MARPLIVELFTGLLFAGLYLWETEAPTRLAAFFAAPPPMQFLTADLPLADHLRYVSHVLLAVLMLAASLIDLDEQTIPDEITVFGTLAGLLLAVAYPWSLLPAGYWVVDARPCVEFLSLASPQAWPGRWPAGRGRAAC